MGSACLGFLWLGPRQAGRYKQFLSEGVILFSMHTSKVLDFAGLSKVSSLPCAAFHVASLPFLAPALKYS